MAGWANTSVLGLTLLVTGCAGLPASTYYPDPRDSNTTRVATTLYRAASAAGDDPTRYSFAFIRTRHPVVYTDEDATFYISDGLATMPMPVLEGTIAQAVAHEVLDHVGTRRRMSAGMTGGFSIAGLFMPGVGMLDFMVNPLVVRAFSRKLVRFFVALCLGNLRAAKRQSNYQSKSRIFFHDFLLDVVFLENSKLRPQIAGRKQNSLRLFRRRRLFDVNLRLGLR